MAQPPSRSSRSRRLRRSSGSNGICRSAAASRRVAKPSDRAADAIGRPSEQPVPPPTSSATNGHRPGEQVEALGGRRGENFLAELTGGRSAIISARPIPCASIVSNLIRIGTEKLQSGWLQLATVRPHPHWQVSPWATCSSLGRSAADGSGAQRQPALSTIASDTIARTPVIRARTLNLRRAPAPPVIATGAARADCCRDRARARARWATSRPPCRSPSSGRPPIARKPAA